MNFIDRLADKIDLDKLMGIVAWVVLVSGIAAFIYWGWL